KKGRHGAANDNFAEEFAVAA
nr:Chain B, C. crescentus ssrA peptide [synthetic construct]